MHPFDSLSQAKRSVNRQAAFRKLGSADIQVAFSVGDQHRIVKFDAFSVGQIQTANENDLRNIGIRLRLSEKQWRFYLRRRKVGKLPSLIGFALDNDILKFSSPVDRFRLLRVHQTVQAFIDAWARYAS